MKTPQVRSNIIIIYTFRHGSIIIIIIMLYDVVRGFSCTIIPMFSLYILLQYLRRVLAPSFVSASNNRRLSVLYYKNLPLVTVTTSICPYFYFAYDHRILYETQYIISYTSLMASSGWSNIQFICIDGGRYVFIQSSLTHYFHSPSFSEICTSIIDAK